MKYKNKDGIELSYEGHDNDVHIELIKEVIKESIKLVELGAPREEVIKFLEENFSV